MPTYEEMRELREKRRKEEEERNRNRYECRLKELEKHGVKPVDMSNVPPRRCDHPNTMEDGTATVLWIVVMLVGSIFKGNWVIWIIATVIWAKFITRYKK
jgi:hypothetical protein